MANTVSTNLSKSFQSLTFLAKGSVQRPTKHKKMPVQNANTFHRKKKNSTQAYLEVLEILWGWERKRWIFGRDCLGKASVNHSPGRMVVWKRGRLDGCGFLFTSLYTDLLFVWAATAMPAGQNLVISTKPTDIIKLANSKMPLLQCKLLQGYPHVMLKTHL